MPGSYPFYHSLVEKLAGKVISRVVHDGVDLGDAIKEACNFAKLSRQQTIHMCAVLQDYGMQYNGDPKDYFYTPDDLGKDFPNTEKGYVVYANSGSKAVQGSMNRIFKTIANLQKQGFSNSEIIELNPDLEPILNSMEEVVGEYKQIAEDIERAGKSSPEATHPTIDNQDQAAAAKPITSIESMTEGAGPGDGIEPELQLAAAFRRNRLVIAQEADVAPATPGNVKDALKDANAPAAGGEAGGADLPPLPEQGEGANPAGELGGMDQGGEEEITVGDEEGPADSVSATVKPSPADLDKKIQGAPEWEVENILSIQSAENFYTNLRKELEAVVFNENISLDKEALKKYDGVRSKIDEQLDKISEAQKEKKKLEEKETDLSDQFEGGEQAPAEEFAVEGEAPTEEVAASGEAPAEEFEVAQEPK